VENIDNVEHSLHPSGFSGTVPFYDTSFPILVERCTRISLFDVLSSLLEFLVTVIDSGSTQQLFSQIGIFITFILPTSLASLSLLYREALLCSCFLVDLYIAPLLSLRAVSTLCRCGDVVYIHRRGGNATIIQQPI
jgi:hypothetical protein